MSRHWIPNPSGFSGSFRQLRSRQIFERLEQTPDLRHAEIRFAAEVAVAELLAEDVPSFAHERAFETLLVMAKG